MLLTFSGMQMGQQSTSCNTHKHRTRDTTWCHVTSCHATCHHTSWCDVRACYIHRRCQRRYMILHCLIENYLRLRQRILHTHEIQVTPHDVTLQDITLHEVTHSIRDFTSKLNIIELHYLTFFFLVYALKHVTYSRDWLRRVLQIPVLPWLPEHRSITALTSSTNLHNILQATHLSL